MIAITDHELGICVFLLIVALVCVAGWVDIVRLAMGRQREVAPQEPARTTDWFAEMNPPDNQWHSMNETPREGLRLQYQYKNGEPYRWKYDTPSLP